MRQGILAALLLTIVLPSYAAQIEVHEDTGKPPVIGISGNIEAAGPRLAF
jgi:hypothetical protein